ncbi:hypothetical protein B0I37DRAFT_301551 [Chaetomium sp. MPI-CAGE-AT-0009]|nr:hypothetical protein B0I37DRAFT_301551 [Chaetomium sp. MPI-CAGE-AT-0009]
MAQADLRGWLEAAIADSDAGFPAASESATLVGTEIPDHNRKLATVRRVTTVTELDEDHNIIAIDGWRVVTKKTNRFAPGKYVLFLEVDAFLPQDSEYNELFSQVGPPIEFNDKVGYRVGTTAWTDSNGNQVISQGHIFHLSKFHDINRKVCDWHYEHIKEPREYFAEQLRGLDFSAELGIKKWESFPEEMPVPNQNMKVPTEVDDQTGIATSNPKPPSFVLKADSKRVQNCPNLFTKAKYQQFVFQETLKMDGATIAIYFINSDTTPAVDLPSLPPLNQAQPQPQQTNNYLPYAIHPNGRMGVCTRNQDLLPHLTPSPSAPQHTHFWDAAIAANLHTTLPALGRNLVVQAELVGATVQGNPYNYPLTAVAGGRPTHELLVFSVSDVAVDAKNGGEVTARRWHPRRVETFAAEHGLRHVPVLGYATLPSLARDREDLVVRAELKKGEGLVFKNCVDGRWFKVLSSRWLLEKGDEMQARKQMGKGKGKKGGRGCRRGGRWGRG